MSAPRIFDGLASLWLVFWLSFFALYVHFGGKPFAGLVTLLGAVGWGVWLTRRDAFPVLNRTIIVPAIAFLLFFGWLSPVQVVVATITSDADDYAAEVVAKLKAAGLRAELDTRNEKINYKIRELSADRKIPVIAVVGRREAEEGKLALRRLGSQGQQIVTVDDAIAALTDEATSPDLKR